MRETSADRVSRFPEQSYRKPNNHSKSPPKIRYGDELSNNCRSLSWRSHNNLYHSSKNMQRSTAVQRARRSSKRRKKQDAILWGLRTFYSKFRSDFLGLLYSSHQSIMASHFAVKVALCVWSCLRFCKCKMSKNVSASSPTQFD